MIKLIKCELIKTITLKSFILAFITPLLMSIIGLINIYRGVIESPDLWDSFYNQTLLLYSALILPLIISLIISLQWRLEFKTNSLTNLLSSGIDKKNIFLSKIISTFIIIFINVLILIVLLLIFFPLILPNENFRLYVIYGPLIGLLSSIPFILLQHIFSTTTKNFIGSSSMGIILTFMGFILSHSITAILIPSSYIAAGSFMGVTKYTSSISLDIITYPHSNYLVILVPILAVVLYNLGFYFFNKIDY